VQSQKIRISGNGIEIKGNGTNTPSSLDGTIYNDVNVGDILTHSFSILNNEKRNKVKIESIVVNSNEFIVTHNLKDLSKGQSGIFDVTFRPTYEGFQFATISIVAKVRKKKKTFTFNIIGNETGINPEEGLMITQYYENESIDYIEIKNLSNVTTKNKEYYLAHYKRKDNISKAPKKGNSIEIKSMLPGEVRVYNRFRLRGNDIVIISTSKGGNCFADRIDIIGEQTGNWGRSTSFTKGGCASETAHLDFDINDWIEVDHATVNASNNRQNIYIGTYTVGPIVWNGSAWSDSGLPDLSRIAIINGSYQASSGNIEACDLEINSNLNFDSNTTNSVILHRNLNNYGSFTIGDQESLVMYDDTATIIGNITKKESSTFRNNTYDMTYWSSPIANANIDNVFTGVNPNRIYHYDQSQSSASDPNDPTFWNTWMLASGNMAAGKGYATEGISGTTGQQEISYTGKSNNGIIEVDIIEWPDNDDNNDFNLIGNPYPSAIDIELFFDANLAMIDPTVYLWTHNTPISNGDSGDFSFDDYATYNYTGGTAAGTGPVPDKNIGSSQGFFMRAINSGTVLFNNSMRMENANDQFFKVQATKESIVNIDERDRIWLNLKTDKGGFNQLLIGFTPMATEGVDRGYDALKFEGGNSISFYSIIDSQKYSIQGLGDFSSDNTINLGYDTRVAPRTFSISIEKLEGMLRNSDIYIVDNLLNITHDLKISDYRYDVDEIGKNPDRFTLTFTNSVALSTDKISNISDDNLIISNLSDVLKFNSRKIISSLIVYDILGRKLMDAYPDSKLFEFETASIKAGTILLIEATLDNKTVISKKTIIY
jgi:hypothetical protein